MKILMFVFAISVAVAAAYQKSDIVSARIETCRGCSLNRLPEVKSFVMEDAPFYDRVDVKFISGATPEVILLGSGDRELERLALTQLSRQECNDLLQDKGFTKKGQNSDL